MKEKIKVFYKKHLLLPSVVDLGIHSYNALPLRMVQPHTKEYTWEDYDKEVQIRFPVRYFIWIAIPSFFRKTFNPIRWKVSDFIYKVKCHVLKSHRFHLVDIRQSKESSYYYRFGYIDACDKILLANFNILKEFVESGGATNLLDTYSIEEIKSQGLMAQHEHYLEMMEIYRWWTVGRKEMIEQKDKLFDSFKNEKDESVYRLKSNEFFEAEQQFDQFEDEMLIRLMKIRRGLWD